MLDYLNTLPTIDDFKQYVKDNKYNIKKTTCTYNDETISMLQYIAIIPKFEYLLQPLLILTQIKKSSEIGTYHNLEIHFYCQENDLLYLKKSLFTLENNRKKQILLAIENGMGERIMLLLKLGFILESDINRAMEELNPMHMIQKLIRDISEYFSMGDEFEFSIKNNLAKNTLNMYNTTFNIMGKYLKKKLSHAFIQSCIYYYLVDIIILIKSWMQNESDIYKYHCMHYSSYDPVEVAILRFLLNDFSYSQICKILHKEEKIPMTLYERKMLKIENSEKYEKMRNIMNS